jgi:flavin-dependent thymidylate synthase
MATLKDGSEVNYVLSRPIGTFDINVLLADKAFNKHSLNDGHHVSPYDNNRIEVGLDNLHVKLVQGIDEYNFQRTLRRAQQATIGLPVDDSVGYGEDDWKEMLKGGLQTALESQVVIFEVFGVARATTHQIVRSRRAAFHQQSMRASYMGGAPQTRMPESVWRNPKARSAFMAAVSAAHHAYRTACEEDISYQDARYILPIGTCTYIMCEYNVREFLALYDYRACSMFQWEICSTVRAMGDLLKEAHPWLAPYIKISCEKSVGPIEYGGHKCTFQGWEDVEDGCDFPWARYENRTFKPVVHRIRTHRNERSD